MSDSTVNLTREEYNKLKIKADLFDHYVETEEIDRAELKHIKKALTGRFFAKSEFLKKHSYLV